MLFWGPFFFRHCTTRCERYLSKDDFPSHTPFKLTDKRRRVTSKESSQLHSACLRTLLSFISTKSPLKKNFSSVIHVTTLFSIQPPVLPFPISHSIKIDYKQLQSIHFVPPQGLALIVHTPIALGSCLQWEEQHHPLHCLPGRIHFHPPPLFRLSCGDSLAAMLLWARTVGCSHY